MATDDKLPRGHAYIYMRNRGCAIDIDYPEVDSEEAARILEAVMAIITIPVPSQRIVKEEM